MDQALIDDDLFRTVSSRRVLSGFGAVFRDPHEYDSGYERVGAADGAADALYALSDKSARADAFISHSWSDHPTLKWLALSYYANMNRAVAASLVTCLALLAVLLVHSRGDVLAYGGAWWLLPIFLSAPLVAFVLALGGGGRRRWWLDKLCVLEPSGKSKRAASTQGGSSANFLAPNGRSTSWPQRKAGRIDATIVRQYCFRLPQRTTYVVAATRPVTGTSTRRFPPRRGHSRAAESPRAVESPRRASQRGVLFASLDELRSRDVSRRAESRLRGRSASVAPTARSGGDGVRHRGKRAFYARGEPRHASPGGEIKDGSRRRRDDDVDGSWAETACPDVSRSADDPESRGSRPPRRLGERDDLAEADGGRRLDFIQASPRRAPRSVWDAPRHADRVPHGLSPRADMSPMNRGDAAAATWIVPGDQLWRRRGCDVDIPWRQVAATPRLRHGSSVETGTRRHISLPLALWLAAVRSTTQTSVLDTYC